ncbi:MAG: T9SS type A sorting domain-containing protein [Bacteroidales bacterium]|nr:T9SS type A sorting domain-containing protein [Bacteroidales bacterium]
MKRFILILVGFSFVFAIYSQNKSILRKTKSEIKNMGFEQKLSKAEGDTIIIEPASFSQTCADSLTSYIYTNDEGYITGKNVYGDQEFAQKYTSSYNGKIIAILAAVNSPSQSGTSSARIYSVASGTGEPGNTLGQSTAIDNSTITSASWVSYWFDNPFTAPTTGMFASIILPTGSSDEFLIFTTKENCYSNDDLAWVKAEDNTWATLTSFFEGGLNLDLAIEVAIDMYTGFNSNKNDATEKLYGNYPNPVNNNSTVILYDLKRASNVSLTINDITGKQIYSQNLGNVEAGKHSYELNTNDFGKGIYFLNLITDRGTSTNKMIINK